jgi:lysozyme family protein
MQDGIHRNIPRTDVAEFRRDLLGQASDENVSLDIQQTSNADGTVNISWHVLAASSPIAAPVSTTVTPLANPQADAEAPDPHTLALQAMAAIAKLAQQSTNGDTRNILAAASADIAAILHGLSSQIGQSAANDLNDVTDRLVDAIAQARADPLSPGVAAAQAALQAIGDGLGASARVMRGASADTADAPASSTVVAPPAPPDGGQGSVAAAPISTAGLLRKDSATLLATCRVTATHIDEVARVARRVAANAQRYQDVVTALGGHIPWFFIGVIHSLESNFSFTRHLHNGDPLTARTVQEPRGRPVSGSPPFTWEASAADALRGRKLDQVADWPLVVILDELERYNGTGYVSRGINSPYLWSFSQHWTKGKFVKDHVFDPNATSDQCGGAVILRQLIDIGVLQLSADGQRLSGEAALGHSLPLVAVSAADMPDSARAELSFPGILQEGSLDQMSTKRVQEWCTFQKCATSIDGGFGDGTATAVRAFQSKLGIPAIGVVDQRTWSALTAPMLAAIAPLANRPTSLNEAVVVVGRQHAAQHPIELGGDNRGAWVRLYMSGTDGINQEWCAGFACFVVEQAAGALGVAMPFPRQVGVQNLINDARQSGRLILGNSMTTSAARLARLQPGCLFVIKTPTMSHAGIVLEVRGDGFTSVEGNTNEDGGDRGFEATIMQRNYAEKDFVLLA